MHLLIIGVNNFIWEYYLEKCVKINLQSPLREMDFIDVDKKIPTISHQL